MIDTPEGEFYVGYFPQAPAALGRFLRLVVAGILGVGLVIAIVLAMAQRPFSRGEFEYGHERSLVGRISLDPYPVLAVPRAAAGSRAAAYSRYLLGAPGKHGAAPALAGLDGRWARLDGTLAYRGNRMMLEVVKVENSPAPGDAPAPDPVVDLGRFTLTGEIVDSKCWLGVMKPGELKPHKACAIRCISGGLPPLFVVKDSSGASASLLLVSEQGEPVNRKVLGMIAEPLTITGRVTRQGDLLTLAADPAGYRRAP